MEFIGRRDNPTYKREFSITKDKRIGDSIYYIVKGQVFINEASRMETVLQEAVDAGNCNIVIDMQEVSVFGSAGIRVVLSMYKKLKARGNKLQISSPSENVKNVLGMVALEELLLK